MDPTSRRAAAVLMINSVTHQPEELVAKVSTYNCTQVADGKLCNMGSGKSVTINIRCNCVYISVKCVLIISVIVKIVYSQERT